MDDEAMSEAFMLYLIGLTLLDYSLALVPRALRKKSIQFIRYRNVKPWNTDLRWKINTVKYKRVI